MKKLHFSFVAIFFALLATVSLAACSSSDDDMPSSEDIRNNIVGMWQKTHISGWAYDDTKDENLIQVDKDLAEEESQRYLFKNDGTCSFYYYSSYYSKWVSLGNYTYEISGSRILIYNNKMQLRDSYTVLSLNGDVAVLQYTMDDGEQYKTNITCKKLY